MPTRQRPSLFLCCLLALLAVARPTLAQAEDIESPHVVALLAQAEAAERGVGLRASRRLAISLYCDAARLGSAEAYFRVGRLHAQAARPLANAYLALAARLGHAEALGAYDERADRAGDEALCAEGEADGDDAAVPPFDLDGYVGAMLPGKRKIAALIREYALSHGVEPSFALAVALAESNLDAQAVSPKNAQGVMQLIPETQQRFGVKNAFNAEQNIRGGIAYLKWLQQRFAGKRALVAAAYNAGEGAVERYGDIPPYPETRDYVRRVLRFAGGR